MNKRGAVEVDWIVSIGIFLVFLAVFFIYLAPFGGEQVNIADALLFDLEHNIRQNATWHVSRVPVIIHSNTSSIQPVIAPFDFTWANISFADNASFFRQENKLIYKPQLSKGANIMWVVNSNEAYLQPTAVADLAPTNTEVMIDSSRFHATFKGLPVSVQHFDKNRVSTFNLSINGVLVSTESATSEANFSNLAAKYKLVAPQLNHTTFVVGDFSRFYNYVVTDKVESQNVTIEMTLHNYTHYFFDNTLSGPLNFTENACVSKFTNFADFYDSLGGLSFIVDDSADMSFCMENNSVRMSLVLGLDRERNYNMVFHSGDYTETQNLTSAFTVRIGMVENLTGLSLDLLGALNRSDYEALKSDWSYPGQREFTFQLLNSSNSPILNYTPVVPGVVNQFVQEFEEVILDKYGLKEKHKLRLRGW